MRAIVLDTETSGFPPEAGVCEIGWVELNEQAEWTTKVEALIDPGYPISPSASGIHGIVDEDVANSPTLEEFFSLDDPSCYGKRLSGEPLVLVAHKASFDAQFVRPYVDGEVLELCTLRWARALYPEAPDHKLSTLKYLLGLRKDAGEAHRVMADIWVCYDLLHHILQRVGCSLAELAERSRDPMLMHKMPFGKHRGVNFNEIPRSYCKWALDNMAELDIDLRYSFEYYYNKR